MHTLAFFQMHASNPGLAHQPCCSNGKNENAFSQSDGHLFCTLPYLLSPHSPHDQFSPRASYMWHAGGEIGFCPKKPIIFRRQIPYGDLKDDLHFSHPHYYMCFVKQPLTLTIAHHMGKPFSLSEGLHSIQGTITYLVVWGVISKHPKKPAGCWYIRIKTWKINEVQNNCITISLFTLSVWFCTFILQTPAL